MVPPRLRPFIAIAALLFLVAHLPFLARTLDDIDSINFALGIRRFDPTLHRPHPPGYPIYIAIGKAGTAVLDVVRPPANRSRPGAAVGPQRDVPASSRGNEVTVLAFWSALFGALALWPLMQFFGALEQGSTRRESSGAAVRGAGNAEAWRAAAAAGLTLACPVYWFTAVRPMSDLPGLAMTLIAQALLATAFARQGLREGGTGMREGPAVSGRLIVLGSFTAAVAIGFRSQAAWLTLPLLAVVLLDRAGRGAAAALLGSVMSFAIGAALWAVPLVIAAGGWTRYLRAVFDQAGEDFSGVDMFLNFPSARRLALGLVHTFVLPWGWTPVAVIVIGLAVVGGLVMLWRSRPSLVLLAAAVGPYAIFHLLVQETITTRYALPLIPAMAFLAVQGLRLVLRRFAPLGAAAIALACLVLAVPATRLYAASGSPLFRALDEIERLARPGSPGTLGMHQVFARGIEAGAPAIETILPSPPRREWLELAKYWQAGGSGPIWFLADPRRTDLALVDPASRHLVRFFGWSFPSERVMSGVRPDTVELLRIDPPGWFALQGWALTPETAGMARFDHAEPGTRPISAWVRHRSEPVTLMIGGRNLQTSGPSAEISVTFDGRTVRRWTVEAGPRSSLVFVDLAAGALEGAGTYGRLDIAASSVGAGTGPANVAIKQFDLQPLDRPVAGFDAGWHEAEFSLSQGRSWRWTSEAARLRVRHGGHDLVLHLAGEDPLRNFDGAPIVVVRAGTEVLHRFEPASSFSIDVIVPRAALDSSEGLLTIETSRIFVPDERTGNGDDRHLGLRMFDVRVRPR
jgi:hypothetical protein